jgi:hypothetical protein
MSLHAWYPGSGVLAPRLDGPWGSVGCQPAAGSAVRRLALFLDRCQGGALVRKSSAVLGPFLIEAQADGRSGVRRSTHACPSPGGRASGTFSFWAKGVGVIASYSPRRVDSRRFERWIVGLASVSVPPGDWRNLVRLGVAGDSRGADRRLPHARRSGTPCPTQTDITRSGFGSVRPC